MANEEEVKPINDQDAVVETPEGQLPDSDAGNDNLGDNQSSKETNDFVDFKGVKVPVSEFENIAKERYKDHFDAYENKSKWQAENTRRAQELKAVERDAEAYRRLLSERQYQPQQQPQNPQEAQKRSYVEKKKQQFPDVDPRFFESQYEDLYEMSGIRAKETISPILEEQAKDWEKNFVKEHPLIQTGDENYYKLVDLIKKGYDPEHGYSIVYAKELGEQAYSERTKARDAENKRKLQQTQKTSTGSVTQKPTEDESFEKAWAKYGG